MARTKGSASIKPRHFQWERLNSSLILAKFAKARKIRQNGCSFNGGDYQFWLPVLNTAVRAINPEAAQQKDRCIRSSLSDASLTLTDPDAFLLRCDQEFEVLSRRPKSRFVLYTSITYTGPKLIDWIAEGSTRVYWGPQANGTLLRKIRKAQEEFSPQRQALRLPSDEHLTPMLVRVSAYDPADAFETANDCIDRFRGLLNLLINSSNSINPFGDRSAPHAVNRFRRGPLHTIHNPDGSLAAKTFWYEHRWLHNEPSVVFKDPPDYRKHVQKWWKKLQDHKMRDFISEALLRYCRALDLHEAEASFLGMWQVLETLTGSDKYDQLIDRVVRLYKDPEEAREIAKHLRIRRNQTVHSAGEISKEANAILIQAEAFASQALFFFLSHGGKFRSLSELHSFLDLPLVT